MPHIPEHSHSVSDGRVMPDHQLSSGRNKVERIGQHSKGLFDDLKEWVELRIELVRLDVKHELEVKKNEVIVIAVVGVLAALGVLFLLAATAFGLGAWLGHPAWGFLIVGAVLLLIAGIYWSRTGPRRMERTKEFIVETANPDPKDDKDNPRAKDEVREP